MSPPHSPPLNPVPATLRARTGTCSWFTQETPSKAGPIAGACGVPRVMSEWMYCDPLYALPPYSRELK